MAWINNNNQTGKDNYDSLEVLQDYNCDDGQGVLEQDWSHDHNITPQNFHGLAQKHPLWVVIK